jgi:MerR family mercuric resistance operon transcriptional regulator
MKIGELAAATGCHFETIRYYEKVGLLPKPQRTASGYRAYRPGDIARVRFITRGRALGFSLDEIRSLLHLSESPNLACGDVDALARQHLAEVREKLAQLQRMEAELVATIERCRGGQRATCAVLESLALEGGPLDAPVSVHSPLS